MGSQADLGFIRNRIDLRAPNRMLFGTPGYTSQKGVMTPNALFGHSAPSEKAAERKEAMAAAPAPAPATTMEPPSDPALLGRRCEYLEEQLRGCKETLDATSTKMSELQQANATLADALKKASTIEKMMYDEMQCVYGRVGCKALLGVQSVEGDIIKVIDEREALTLVPVAKEGECVLLVYPMREVRTKEDWSCFMRMKAVDPRTGQLRYVWALVFQCTESGEETRFISQYSTAPLA